MKTEKIRLSDVELNTGQVPGLPSNPREWTRQELNKLKKSIRETPELLEARGIIVYPQGEKFVVLGGNMRLAAARELKMDEVPCIVVPEETPVEKLKEIVIKDNGSFGSWDFDALGNEWDDLPLTEWSVPAWDDVTSNGNVSSDDFEESFSLCNKQQSDMKQISFSLSRDDADRVLEIISLAKYTDTYENRDNDNSNGVSLKLITEEWLVNLAKNINFSSLKNCEDIRKELKEALNNSGLSLSDVDAVLGNQMSGHYFNPSQWQFPTKENFEKLSTILTFKRSYQEIRNDYLVAIIHERLEKKWELLKK